MGPILWEEWEEGEPSIVSPPTPLDCYTRLTDVSQKLSIDFVFEYLIFILIIDLQFIFISNYRFTI